MHNATYVQHMHIHITSACTTRAPAASASASASSIIISSSSINVSTASASSSVSPAAASAYHRQYHRGASIMKAQPHEVFSEDLTAVKTASFDDCRPASFRGCSAASQLDLWCISVASPLQLLQLLRILPCHTTPRVD